VYWTIWILPGIVGGYLALAGAILIRKGQRGGGISFIFAGALTFAFYGVAVNVVPWSFSRLIFAYVAAFTLITFIWRQFVFGQKLSKVTWLGVAIVVVGSLIVVFGEAS
jgi:drug/metabolite transporter superfamily protein YnfA